MRDARWLWQNRIMLRCLIVDDNHPFTQAARRLLERGGLAVVGVASTGDEAIDLVRQLRPDVVILDINLGPESGFDVAKRLRSELTQDGPTSVPEIILVSAQDQDDFAELISESPTAGFIPKSDLSGEAIRRVLYCSEGASNVE
jgi:DNA-binding NarL/FixJ family response regulator